MIARAWLELRGRFYLATAILMMLAVLRVALFSQMEGLLARAQGAPDGVVASLRQTVADYGRYIDSEWFNGTALPLMSILMVLLAIGGTPAEKRDGMLLISLSLPVPRHAWVTRRAAMVVGLGLAMILSATATVLAASWILGRHYPPGAAVLQALAVVAAALPWVGVALLAGTFVRDQIRAALATYAVLLACWMIVTVVPHAQSWDPWLIAGPSVWRNGLPVEALVVAALLGPGGFLLALRRFGRAEY